MIRGTPRLPRRTPFGVRPLDDPTTVPPTAPSPSDRANRPARGLRAQFEATRDATLALVRAHVDLARTEVGEIASEVGRMVALAALAIAVVLLALLLLLIGGALFLAEWLLGSMGWGILHGFLLAVGVALAAGVIVVGLPASRVGRWFLVALVIALAVGGALGLELPNQLYRNVGESAGLSVEAGVRPLVAGLLLGALVGLVLGVVLAALAAGSGGGRLATVIALIVIGALAGAVSAVTFGPQVGAAVGITVGYLTWIGLMVADVVRSGIDTERLKQRFYPTATIETSKETLEWLQKRMPPGIGS
jgi:MFS family permease